MIIKIKNLHAKTFIGVYEWEKHVQRDLILNIELELDGSKAIISDDVLDTVNYDALSQMIITEVAASRFNLLEKLADHLLEKIMKNSMINRAKIEIDKGGVVQNVENVSVTDERIRKA